MNKRLIFVLMLMACCVAGAWADEVTEKKAQELAKSFVNSHLGRKGGGSELKSLGKVSGLYVFSMSEEGGFVIVSNDDATIPILGYSDKGALDPNDMPDNMRAWLQGYADEIAWVQKNNIKKQPAAKARTRAGSHATTAIGPLITTKWNQRKPYNLYCPLVDQGYNVVTGCVATAMAQVMYYTENKAGNATTTTTKDIPSYNWTCNGTTYTLGPIQAGSVINWSKMKNEYSSSDTDEHATAVATLMKYCGYSVKMSYGSTSNAYINDVADALKSYFGYSETTQYKSRSQYSYANWTDLIYNELSQGRPVLYGGQAVDNGHAFVCNGYKYENDTDLFYINWGWGGVSDGYFVLSVLNPDQQGAGGSPTNSAYTTGQEAVVGIQKKNGSGTVLNVPTNTVDLTINSISVSPSIIFLGESVEVTINVTNNSSDAYDGELALVVNNGLDIGKMFVIPAKTTQNCVFNYKPTAAGSYTLNCAFPNDEGGYSWYNNPNATFIVADETPRNVSASDITLNSAVLSWTQDIEVTAWKICLNDDGNNLIDANSNPFTLSGLSSETQYTVKVGAVVGSVIKWSTAITFTTESLYPAPKNLTASKVTPTTAQISWTGSANSYNVRYRSVRQDADVFFDDFENGLGRWTIYTKGEAGDNNGWYKVKSDDMEIPAHSGSAYACARSWNGIELDADNWLVTPNISFGGTLKFWVRTNSYFPDSYEVLLSNTGNAIADFTFTLQGMAEAPDNGEWNEVTIDLSNYAGQGYIAIHHVSYDCDFLLIDDFGVYPVSDWTNKSTSETTIELNNLNPNYTYEYQLQAVYTEGTSNWTSSATISNAFELGSNATNNGELIEAWNGQTTTVILKDRTLFKDGSWNTLCLPFPLSAEQLAASPLAGADIRTMTDASLSGGTLTLNFTPRTGENAVTSIAAGTPYIIKWTKAEGYEQANAQTRDVRNPTFTGVTISNQTNGITSGNVTFKGTYSPVNFNSTDATVLFLGDNNMLYFPENGAKINACRAYFQLDGITAGDVNKARLLVNDSSATEIISTTLNDDGLQADDHWYDLSGRRLSGKPSAKGIYIRGGRKVVIK